MKPRLHLLLTLGLLGSCAEIDAYEADVCGNNVVEPGAGEDCDLVPDDALGEDLSCGPPDGSAQQCRYVCDGAECPWGWACEDDGICRPPSGRFEIDEDPALIVGGQELAVHDVDGDETAEIVVRLEGDVVVFAADDVWFGERFSLSLPAVRGELAFADVDGDELQDILVPAVSGVLDSAATPRVHVLRSDGQRLITAVAPQQLAEDPLVGVTGVELEPDGAQVLLRTRIDDDSLTLAVSEPSCRRPDVDGTLTLENLRDGAVPPALPGFPFPGGAPHVLVPSTRQAALFVVSVTRTCGVDVCDPASPTTVPCVTTLERVQTVPLPAQVAEPGCVWLDADADGDDDVLCNLEGDRLAVVTNLGMDLEDGREASAIATDLAVLPDTQPRGCAPAARVLAAGDFDADGRDDLVTPHGVFLGSDAGFQRAFARVLGDGWGESVVGDFDRDGRLEIVATVLAADRSCTAARLESLRETDGAYGDAVVRDATLPSTLRIGDFDGDGLADVAVVEKASDGQQVAVFFGDTREPLRDKVTVGPFASVDTIAAVRDREGTEINEDLVSDLAIVSEGGEFLTIATGTTSRSMLSPERFEGATGLGRVVTLGGALLPREAGDDERPPDVLTVAGEHAWLLRDDDVHHGDTSVDLGLDGFDLDPACTRWATGGEPQTPLVVAIDGHRPAGVPDTCDPSGPSRVVVARVEGPRRSPHWVTTSTTATANTPLAAHVADLDGSGVPDVLVLFEGSLQWWRDPQPGAPAPAEALVPLLPGEEIWAVTPIDVDAQTDLELAVLTPAGVAVLEFDALGDPLPSPVIPLPYVPTPEARRDLLAGDIDGDGIDDLILALGEGIWLYPAELRP